MSESLLSTLLLTVLIPVVLVLLFQKQQPTQPSSLLHSSSKDDDTKERIRELQQTVRLLIETNARQSLSNSTVASLQQPSSPQTESSASLSPPATSHSRRNSENNESRLERPVDLPDYISRHQMADSLKSRRLIRKVSQTALTIRPSDSAVGVPLHVYEEIKELTDAVKRLESKNRELNRQLTLNEVSNVVEVEQKYKYNQPIAEYEMSTSSQLPPSPQHQALSIKHVKLTASEIETIRAIFYLFDTNNTGQISVREIKALHSKLGEPLSDAEALQAQEELDVDGSGSVNFNKFLLWWSENHSGGKRSSSYRTRFKLIHAKLNSKLFDVDKIITQDSGEKYTLEYRLNFYYKGANQSLKQISPWHDIPLYRVSSSDVEVNDNNIFNMVCEIPKWTRAKFECATGEIFNPIKQDTQHGKLRYYKHGDMMFNYGFLPQTWEDPSYCPEDTGCPGDNDPIDCVEIGALQLPTGAVAAVKVLGVLALIDDGETDWKVICISISDSMSHLINDIDDVETHLPGAIKAIREYFRDYKSFSGKINTYGLKAQCMPKSYAVKVIDDTHKHWKNLHIVRKENIVGKGGASISVPHTQNSSSTNVTTGAPTATETDVPIDVSVSLSPKLDAQVKEANKEVKEAEEKGQHKQVS